MYCPVLHCSTLPPDINPFAVNNNNNDDDNDDEDDDDNNNNNDDNDDNNNNDDDDNNNNDNIRTCIHTLKTVIHVRHYLFCL